MRYHQSTKSRFVAAAAALLLFAVSAALGQDTRTTSRQRANAGPPLRTVSAGQKAKCKGGIVARDSETLRIRDDQDIETVVLMTERTSIKSKGGFFRWGKDFDSATLVRGLQVEVEGVGNREGQLVADKVRFDSSDLKVARLVDKRVTPVEEANQRLSGQVEEVGEVSKNAHKRISSLDDYSVQDSATIYFRVNSAVIAPEDRRTLDDLARKATQTTAYVIEIAGYADSTGNMNRNRVLSQQRADAVVRYLQENHDIPLRRMVTAFGYGQLKPAADNSTAEGRRQNRRVEVKILINKGITASGQ